MKNIQTMPIEIQNLQKIYQQFKELEDPQNKLARITAILPFVSLAGLLLIKHPNNQTLTQIRQDFKEYYEKNHHQKLEWQTADFDQELIQKLAKLSNQGEHINQELFEELYDYQHKYRHAHFVAYFYLVDTLKDLELDNQTKIDTIITKTKTRLETEFPNPDDLERHALLNQISDILQSLQQAQQFINDLNKTEYYIKEIDKFTKNTSPQIALSQIAKKQAQIESGSAIIKAGIEIEFSSANFQLSKPKTNYQQIAFLKQVSADYEPRSQLAIKYGKPPLSEINWQNIIPTLPELSLGDGPNANDSYLNQATFNLITNILQQALPTENRTKIKSVVATMLPQEALAFLLLFGKQDELSPAINFKFDGISEDITEVYTLIKNKQFYAKTVDMIHALEVDLFIDQVTEEKLQQLPKKFQELNYWSNFVGWPVTKVNQQVNFSFTQLIEDDEKDLIDYQIQEVHGKKLQATISGIGAEILKTIQNSLQKIDEEHDILRDGTEIAIAFDAKKSGREDYFKQEVAKFKEENPATAFTIHKQIAGKTAEIRVSVIKDTHDKQHTIVEARMLGCNPHNPISHIGAHDYKMLQTIIATVNNDVQAKLKELQQLPQKYQELLNQRVQITDGKAAEIPPIAREQHPNTATRVVRPVERIVSAGAIVALQN